jgi:hypothetical protein
MRIAMRALAWLPLAIILAPVASAAQQTYPRKVTTAYPTPPVRPATVPAAVTIPVPPPVTPAPDIPSQGSTALVIPAPPPAPPVPPVAAGIDCIRALADLGIEATRPDPKPRKDSCVIEDAVVLLSVADRDRSGRRIAFPSKPLLACAMAKTAGRFTSDIAAPLALGMFGKPLAALETGPGFECRSRNRQAGAKPSAHGRGEAVDISSVTLEGGPRITVKDSRDGAAGRYFNALRQAGCGVFTTVLGPGSDAYHSDHLHFDMERRGRDGSSKYCR